MPPGYRPQLTAPADARRGVALVVVLWLLAALAVLAATFASGVGVETKAAGNMLAAARARALADGGIAYGVARLLAQRARPEPDDWQVDGAVYDVAVGGATIGIAITQETGKIDINVAPDEMLANLLTQAGVAADQVDAVLDAIADHRDADDAVRPQGAEAEAYADLGLPYAPKNRVFESIRELAAVPGVTDAVFRAVRPAITVHTGQPRIDPATAPEAALLALPGVVAAEVEALLAVRRENQYSQVKQALPVLSGVQESVGQAAVPVFTIRAQVAFDQGTRFTREAIVWLPDGETSHWLLDWTQGGS